MGRWELLLVLALGLSASCGGRSQHSGAGSGAGTSASGGTGGTGGTIGTAGAAPTPSEEQVACTKNSDCTFVSATCCSCYGTSLGEVVALNAGAAPEYVASSCGQRGCGDCAFGVSDNLLATCQDGRCTAVDLLQTEIVACTTKDDCKVRQNRCCGCDGTTTGPLIPIGVDQDEALERLRCDPDATCDECSVSIPEGPDFYITCFTGRCAIGRFVR